MYLSVSGSATFVVFAYGTKIASTPALSISTQLKIQDTDKSVEKVLGFKLPLRTFISPSHK